jgi:hypothetical protein
VIARDEIVTAELGASAALAGLTLVFLGILVSAYQSAVAGTSKCVLKRYTNPIVLVFATFVLSLTCVGLSLAWLALDGGHTFYRLILVLSIAQLAAAAAAAGLAPFGGAGEQDLRGVHVSLGD